MALSLYGSVGRNEPGVRFGGYLESPPSLRLLESRMGDVCPVGNPGVVAGVGPTAYIIYILYWIKLYFYFIEACRMIRFSDI